ncbi:hypothetical protein EV361DRAFT_926175 [Lentinula raphanica]|nr:hypothetical protein EV361DRAFT_926175 [Lentinula raphanica]
MYVISTPALPTICSSSAFFQILLLFLLFLFPLPCSTFLLIYVKNRVIETWDEIKYIMMNRLYPPTVQIRENPKATSRFSRHSNVNVPGPFRASLSLYLPPSSS